MMNLETMKKMSREATKKKLWTFGYKVKDVSKTMPFDLLVNEKYKVSVYYSNFYKGANCWRIDNLKNLYADVFIFVLIEDGKMNFYFAKNNMSKSFTTFMIKKENLVSSKFFSKTPTPIFNGAVKKITFIPRKLKLEKDEWYSLREASQLLSFNQDFLKTMVRNGEIRAIPMGSGVGTRYKFKGAWIMAFLGIK